MIALNQAMFEKSRMLNWYYAGGKGANRGNIMRDQDWITSLKFGKLHLIALFQEKEGMTKWKGINTG